MSPSGTILIADDEPEIVYLLKDLLVDAGYQVRQASIGQEAVAMILTEPPNLALIDLRHGGMSGLEVIRAVRAQRSVVPVVIMTTNPDQALALAAHGATACLCKPFDLDGVLACVRRYIRV